MFAVSAVWPGFSAVNRLGFVAAAALLGKGANDAWSWLTVDSAGITRRRLLLPRRVEFSEVKDVQRKSHARSGDELVYRPGGGLAFRVSPHAFLDERPLRHAMREATEAAGLTWP